MRPPIKLLAQASITRGIRLPKREQIWKAAHQKACDHKGQNKTWLRGDTYRCNGCGLEFEWNFSRINSMQAHVEARPPKPKREKIGFADIPQGNLKSEDYRFWVGCENGASIISYCRACRKTAYSVKTMLDHMEEHKCTLWLVHAYQRLLEHKKCTVCGKDCTGHKWGVPLCGAECAMKWMFEPRPFAELQVALVATEDKSARERAVAREMWRKAHEADQSAVL